MADTADLITAQEGAESAVRPTPVIQATAARRLWLGAAVAAIGWEMQAAALGWGILEVTGNALPVGLAGVVIVVPSVALASPAARLIERLPRRKLLGFVHAGLLVQSLALFVAWAVDAEIAVLVALAAVGGLLAAVRQPAWQAVAGNAGASPATQLNLARAVGPVVGGLVMAQIDPGACFALAAASSAVMLGVLATTRLPQAVTVVGHVVTPIRESLDQARMQPGAVAGLLLLGLTTLVVAPAVHLLPSLTADTYGAGAGAYGLLRGTLGAGGLLIAVVVILRRRLTHRQLATGGLLASAGGLAVLGLSLTTAGGVVGAVLVGAGASAMTAAAFLAVHVESAEASGATSGLWLLLPAALYPIGVVAQTIASDAGSPEATVVVGALILGAAALAVLGGEAARRPSGAQAAAGVIAVLAGISMAVAPFALSAFRRAEAAERVIDDVRSEVSSEGVARLRDDLSIAGDAVVELQDGAFPAFADLLGVTAQDFAATIRSGYPDLATGLGRAPEIAAFTEKAASNLERHQRDFVAADRIPVPGVPLTVMPWGALALAVLLVGAGAGCVRGGGPAAAGAVLVLAVVVGMAPLAAELPGKLSAAQALLDSLSPEAIDPVETRERVTVIENAAAELEARLFPDVARELERSPAQLDRLVDERFPELAEGRRQLPAILSRFSARAAIRERNADAISDLRSVPLTLLPWLMVGPAAVVVVAAFAALAGVRRRRR